MKLYRTREGHFVATQEQARSAGRGWEKIEVPTNQSGLLSFLNANAVAAESPAALLGRSDAERGITTNPYSSPDLRSEWERGHAEAVELGLAKLPSFSSVALPRSGARRKTERKAA